MGAVGGAIGLDDPPSLLGEFMEDLIDVCVRREMIAAMLPLTVHLRFWVRNCGLGDGSLVGSW